MNAKVYILMLFVDELNLLLTGLLGITLLVHLSI